MTDLVEILFSDCCLLFANDWFLVVAGNIVENNSILINILKYSQASFSSFSVVWLGSSISIITKSIVKLQNQIHSYLSSSYNGKNYVYFRLTLQFLTSNGYHGCFGIFRCPSLHALLCGQHYLQSRSRFVHDLRQGVR